MNDVVLEKTLKKDVLYLLETLHGELLSYLMQKLSNRHDAEDVYQNLYIKLSSLSDVHIANINEPKHYIFRAANNMAIDLIRKQSRIKSDINTGLYEEADTVTSPERIFENQQQANALKAAIVSMPAKRRQVFLLFKYKNMSREEIAHELDMKVQAVEKNLVRALNDCRTYLKKQGVH